MSLAAILPYFRTRLNTLDYKEHDDAFNTDNIPQTVLDRSYHVQLGTGTGNKAGQTVTNINIPVLVRVYFRGFTNPNGARDTAMAAADAILAEVLIESNSQGTTIKAVLFDSVTLTPYDISDDNDIVLEMGFNAALSCEFN